MLEKADEPGLTHQPPRHDPLLLPGDGRRASRSADAMNPIESNMLPFNILFKARNQAIDIIFYDVSSLTFDEWMSLTPWVDRKGKIIVVSPSESVAPGGKVQSIRHYESSDEFLRSEDWKTVAAVAVAGVGSSVCGTAAMARNVADAVGGDVAGIVSGY